MEEISPMKTTIFVAIFTLLAFSANAETVPTGGGVLVPTWQEYLDLEVRVAILEIAKAADIDYSARIDVLEAELAALKVKLAETSAALRAAAAKLDQ